jgi:hypothetical protein
MSEKKRPTQTPSQDGRWLLLIHQIPPSPAYLRVKVGRRLGALGAVAIKNSVYALPRLESAREDFEWVLREIVEGGGDAYICEARFVEGLSDGQVEALFHAARDADFARVAEEARELARALPRKNTALDEAQRTKLAGDIARLRRHLASATEIDFFGAPGRLPADASIAALELRLRDATSAAGKPDATTPPESYRKRTWVTRKGIHVDRIASAWLIRRFIDPEATFRFVVAKGHRHVAGELRFDMYDGEFTHEGEHCSFEVLVSRLAIRDPAVRAIGEIIHDLDLKDDRYARPETSGVSAALAGICSMHADDSARLAAGQTLFDALHEFYRR